MLLIGLAITAVGFGPVIRSRVFISRARPTTGRVVDHVVNAPVVEFDVGDAHVRFVGGRDEAGQPRPLGSDVEVLYDPENPVQARLADTRARPSFLVAVGATVFLAGVLTTWL